MVDEYICEFCIFVLLEFDCIKNVYFIYIGVEDVYKNLEILVYVWKELGDKGVSCYLLFINLGGGMVIDLGGFVVLIFK